jgi:hypothetical protein
VLQEHI